jgi:hypothetical protein
MIYAVAVRVPNTLTSKITIYSWSIRGRLGVLFSAQVSFVWRPLCVDTFGIGLLVYPEMRAAKPVSSRQSGRIPSGLSFS